MTIPVFPTLAGLTFPVKRSPTFSTTAQVAWSGKETRRRNWTYPRHKYELAFDLLRSDTATDFQTFMGFFMSVGGSALAFNFLDVDDNAASNQLIGLGDGINNQFQLARALGGYVEPVFSPIAATVTGGGLYSVSASGLVTFNLPPSIGAAIRWTGTFYWLCRFDDDSIDFEKFMNGMWSVAKAPFTTVKL